MSGPIEGFTGQSSPNRSDLNRSLNKVFQLENQTRKQTQHSPPKVKPKPAVVKVDKVTQVKPRQLLKASGIDTQVLINTLKNHLIDVVCRISPY